MQSSWYREMRQSTLKVGLLFLAALSLVGYIIFAAGFALVYKRLSGNDDLLPTILGHSWEAVISPMWLFAVSSIPLYPVLLARILIKDGIWKQIVQSCLMVVGTFYITGAATTFLLGVVFSLDDHYIFILFMLEKAQTVPTFSGAIMSVFFYLVLMFVLPLTEIRRNQTYSYELIESIK